MVKVSPSKTYDQFHPGHLFEYCVSKVSSLSFMKVSHALRAPVIASF